MCEKSFLYLKKLKYLLVWLKLFFGKNFFVYIYFGEIVFSNVWVWEIVFYCKVEVYFEICFSM